MQRVFVLDKNKKPLMPCHPARARELLKKEKAAVFRYHPFTIILKDRAGGDTQPTQVKIDPGSKVTGVALVANFKNGKKVIWSAEIQHRGQSIKKALDTRRALRRSRRNLTLACHECNQKKGNQSIEEFLANNPERLNQIKSESKKSLKDTAAVNATRWYLFNQLKKERLPIEVGTGGKTKYNRETQNYPKKHWIDAACVGESGQNVQIEPDMQVLEITAMGHGTRKMCNVDKYGFPRSHRRKGNTLNGVKGRTYMGYKTGDIVLAVIPKGKNRGIHIGRIAIRQQPNFKLNRLDGINPKYLKLLQRNDGYGYQTARKEGEKLLHSSYH